MARMQPVWHQGFMGFACDARTQVAAPGGLVSAVLVHIAGVCDGCGYGELGLLHPQFSILAAAAPSSPAGISVTYRQVRSING